MSQENIEIVRRQFDAFNRDDLEAVLDDLSPDYEFHPSGRFMDTQRVYRGRAGFVEFWGAFRAAWKEITIAIDRIEGLDDRVLTLGRFQGRGGGSGAEVNAEGAWLHTVEDGLVVHLRSFASWQEGLQAAGLSE